jgi:hypothetical protein
MSDLGAGSAERLLLIRISRMTYHDDATHMKRAISMHGNSPILCNLRSILETLDSRRVSDSAASLCGCGTVIHLSAFMHESWAE